ncbi:MAG: hypothetical protein ACRCWM_08070 [Sarcina sp.]
MSLDRNYEIEISLKDSKVKTPVMELYSTDSNIFNMFIKLKDVNGTIVQNADLPNFEVILFAVNPDSTYVEHTGVIIEDEDKLLFDLPSKFSNKIGVHKCEFTVKKDTEIICTNSFEYTIKAPVHNGLSPETLTKSSRKVLSPYEEVSQRLYAKCDDFTFDGKVLTMLGDGKVIRKVFLDKTIAPVANKKEAGIVKVGNGLNVNDNGNLTVNKSFIEEVAKKVTEELIENLKRELQG